METTVAIFGSCVTRDAFELGVVGEAHYKVGPYLSRTTINSSLASPVAFADLFGGERRKTFEERCVIDDVLKLHFERLEQNPFDYLLIDLIDERHGILAVEGSAICHSVPFMRMAKAFEIDTGKLTRRLSLDPRVIEETLDNIPRFLARLGAIIDPKRIILHEALWATHYRSADSKLLAFEKATEIARINDVLRGYYARFKSEAPLSAIAPPDEVCIGDEMHRWNLEPFHYSESYYRQFMNQLERLTQAAPSQAQLRPAI